MQSPAGATDRGLLKGIRRYRQITWYVVRQTPIALPERTDVTVALLTAEAMSAG